MVQTITSLPHPQFGDSENLTDEVKIIRATDGTTYSYVKTKGGRRHLQWQFTLTRNKGLELRAFIQSYYRAPIKITDHNGRVWVGVITNNPFEFDTPRAGYPAISPLHRGETQVITLDFEGVEQV